MKNGWKESDCVVEQTGNITIVILTHELWTPQWTEGAPLETDWPAASPWTTQAFTVTWLSPASQRQSEREERRTEIWLLSKLPDLTYMPIWGWVKGELDQFYASESFCRSWATTVFVKNSCIEPCVFPGGAMWNLITVCYQFFSFVSCL